LDLAETNARHAVSLAPGSGYHHHVLANVLARRGQFSEAYAHYQIASSRRAVHRGALYASWGWALHLEGHPRKSLAKLLEGIKADPHFAPLYFNLGGVYFSQRALGEARRAMARAVALAPEKKSYQAALAAIEISK
jgi:Tfp pilus assembly protein PilF